MKINREVKLALAAVAAVCILIWGINFLKGSSLFDSKTTCYGVYDNVGGLKVSSGVIYRGYQVGQVSNIVFTGERMDKVLVEFFLKDNLSLPKDTRAVIQSADLMGSKVINLLPGTADATLQDGDTLIAEVEQGMMEQVGQQIAPFKVRLERLMTSLDSTLLTIREVLDERTVNGLKNSFQSVEQMLDNLEGVSGKLNVMLDENGRVDNILENVEGITENLKNNDERVSRIMDNMSVLSDSLRRVPVNQTVRDLNNMTLRIDSILMKMNRGKGTAGAFLNDNNLYYSLNDVAENLNRLLVEFRYNPKKFIRLSLVDFSAANKEVGEYAVVIYESSDRLAADSDLYKKYSGLKEVKYRDKYLYVVGTYKNLKRAQRELVSWGEEYKDAYIARIDFY